MSSARFRRLTAGCDVGVGQLEMSSDIESDNSNLGSIPGVMDSLSSNLTYGPGDGNPVAENPRSSVWTPVPDCSSSRLYMRKNSLEAHDYNLPLSPPYSAYDDLSVHSLDVYSRYQYSMTSGAPSEGFSTPSSSPPSPRNMFLDNDMGLGRLEHGSDIRLTTSSNRNPKVHSSPSSFLTKEERVEADCSWSRTSEEMSSFPSNSSCSGMLFVRKNDFKDSSITLGGNHSFLPPSPPNQDYVHFHSSDMLDLTRGAVYPTTMSSNDVLPTLRASSLPPHSLYSDWNKSSKRNNASNFVLQDCKSKSKVKGGQFCNFCYRNNESVEVVYSHNLKAAVNGVTKLACPVLRKYVCPVCKQTGDNAHTITYCPEVIRKNGLKRPTPIAYSLNTCRRYNTKLTTP